VVLVGGYGGAAAGYNASAANPYSTAYPIAGVSGYTSYAGGEYGSGDAAAYNNQYGAYGSSTG